MRPETSLTPDSYNYAFNEPWRGGLFKMWGKIPILVKVGLKRDSGAFREGYRFAM